MTSNDPENDPNKHLRHILHHTNLTNPQKLTTLTPYTTLVVAYFFSKSSLLCYLTCIITRKVKIVHTITYKSQSFCKECMQVTKVNFSA